MTSASQFAMNQNLMTADIKSSKVRKLLSKQSKRNKNRRVANRVIKAYGESVEAKTYNLIPNNKLNSYRRILEF
jgi:hypothetical protein